MFYTGITLNTERQRPKSRLRRKKRIFAVLSITCVYLYCFTGEPPEVGRQLQSQASARGRTGNGNGNGNGNRKQGCSHTPYVLIGDILTTMPPIIPYEERIPVPSHIQLCRAFLERSEAYPQPENENPNVEGGNGNGNPNAGGEGINDNGDPNIEDEARKLQSGNGQGGGSGGNAGGNENVPGNLKGKLLVMEDEAVCTDWQAPHLSTLQIYASSLIAGVGKPLGLRYKHPCRKNIMKMHNDPDRPYDYTPVQALLPNNLISKVAVAKVDPDLIKQLCQNCINSFEDVMTASEPPSARTHHCLLMPHGEIAEKMLSQGKKLPMIHVMPSLIDRMRHIADDWTPTTGVVSKNEGEVGVIIAIDEG